MDNSIASIDPLILFYNPQCAKPGYQRLPAALLQVASLVEGVFSYEIVDGNLSTDFDCAEYIIGKVQKRGSRYLAISIMPGPQIISSLRDFRIIKKACPALKIIVGGYFPLIHTEVCVRDKDIDYVVVGSGEQTFLELITVLEKKGDLTKVAGIAYLDNNDTLIKTDPRGPTDPNTLPRYPYQQLDVEHYIVSTFLGSRTLSHHSSFGCPFFCNFCAVAVLAAGRWIGESAERMADLAESMVKTWQINALEFHDNNFFVSEKRVAEFCRQLLDRKLHLNWWGEGRADTLLSYRDSTWELMQASGLKMVFLGAESGDDQTLKQMNKGGRQTTQSLLQLVKRMKTYQIIPELSFILGNPPNPLQDLKRTIRFIRKVKKINPAAEIIMYRYDPVPTGGELFEQVTRLGFHFPETLEAWASPKWLQIQRRTSADLPWLTDTDQILLKNFQTVLNAYYPTTTSRHIQHGSWRYWLLKAFSGIRYHLQFYRNPVELNWLQKKLAYQRPEISGF